MPQFVDWKKGNKTKRVKVCDGWRFLKEGIEVYEDDLTFKNGKWTTFDGEVPEYVTKNSIIVRRIAGSDLNELEPDKTVKISL